MKTIIRTLIRKLGYEISKISKSNIGNIFHMRQTMNEALHHTASLGYHPDYILDVGAADGTKPLLDVYPKSKFIFIEPLVEFEPALKELKKKYNAEYIIAGAGKKKGRGIINIHNDLVSSSIFRETDGKKADGTPREVNIIALDDLISDYKISGNLLLKVDVQGAEIEVLSGARKLLADCDIIILEVSFFSFLKNVPEFYEVISFMKNCGFVVYDLFDGHNRPIDNALAQKDILFVKEKGFFRATHQWATDEQRKIINENN